MDVASEPIVVGPLCIRGVKSTAISYSSRSTVTFVNELKLYSSKSKSTFVKMKQVKVKSSSLKK